MNSIVKGITNATRRHHFTHACVMTRLPRYHLPRNTYQFCNETLRKIGLHATNLCSRPTKMHTQIMTQLQYNAYRGRTSGGLCPRRLLSGGAIVWWDVVRGQMSGGECPLTVL